MFTQLFDLFFQLLRFLLFRPLTLVLHFLYMNVKVCCLAFDPIFDAPPGITRANYRTKLPFYRRERARLAEENLHVYFLLHLGVFLILFVDTVVILASYDFDYTGNLMPELFSHRMFPDHYVYQGDQYILSAGFGFFFTGLVLWARPWLEDRFAMYFVYGPKEGERALIVDGKVWNRENAERIYQTRRIVRKTYVPVGMVSCFVCFSYFFSNFIQKPNTDLKYYFEVFIYLPIISWCFMICVCLSLYHFFAAINYPLMKQAHLRRQMAQLIETLRIPRKRSKAGFRRLWLDFHRINSHLAYQVNEIRGYNRFWSVLLSILFLNNIHELVYLLYGVLIDNPEESQIFNYYYLVVFSGLLASVITRCCLVDFNNDRFYLSNVSACIHFQEHFRVPVRFLAQIETIATNRNFTKACFRLSNGYRLDSTAANMVIYIVSTFFLMVCRRNRRDARFAQQFGAFGRPNGEALLDY